MPTRYRNDGEIVIVERFESALWATTSLLLEVSGEAVLIDPGVSVDEVERLTNRAASLGARVTEVLATHADWDHVCGIAAFPEAAATAAEQTAELIATGEPARIIDRRVQRGMNLPGAPRVDRTFTPGDSLPIGPFVVETLALPGHTPDSVGYRIRELDLLVVGDYLSTVMFPFVWSTAAYRLTLAGLIDLLRVDPPRRVFPGHGRELETAEAIAIAEADLAYLQELHDAVASAPDIEQAEVRALSIPVPRAAPPDLEGARAGNVDAQVAEVFGG